MVENTFDYTNWAADDVRTFKMQCNSGVWTDSEKTLYYNEQCRYINFIDRSEIVMDFLAMCTEYVKKCNTPRRRDLVIKACTGFKSQFRERLEDVEELIESLQNIE